MSVYPLRKKKPKSGYKCCAMCNKVKQEKQFHLLTGGNLHSYCKPCLSIYMRSRYNHFKSAK